ncbi:substrate-binding domain-containing protein [Leisingera thetidis]|uniref:substrate-binding domain-containing protein n=1 Tax=Leisingera thetidis TaxID=2930199 RepID=UPI0021F6E9AB|nr:substrate-binding domain-containing protein [Leisingera thetidis]
MTKKRANLRDVAAAAGVSVATASRVMNTPEAVSEATRQKVQAAMDSLRFMPSAAARAINSGRSRFVGALVPTLDNAIFARYLSRLESQLDKHRLSLVVSTTDGIPGIEAEKARTLVDIGAEALIVSGVTHGAALFELIDRGGIPAIATSCYDPDFALPTIGYDNAAAALTALSHLSGLGHSRISVIHGPTDTNDRTGTRVEALRRRPGGAQLEFHLEPLSIEGGCNGVQKVLQARPDTTAILCMSDVQATGALYELQRRGIPVPGGVSLMGIDDLPGSAHLCPGLTTVHLPVARMGLAAADAIAGWVETRKVPEPSLLKSDLVVRASTARTGAIDGQRAAGKARTDLGK